MNKNNVRLASLKQVTILLLACLFSITTHGQVLQGEVARDPRAGMAIYDFHFNGPPRNAPFALLPPFPLGPDIIAPFPFTPWVGNFALPSQDPLFSFNLQIENQSINALNISDGQSVINGINPGVTCLAVGGCDPIMFILPIQYQPLIEVNFPVQIELHAANIFAQPIFSEEQILLPPPVLDFGFIDPFQPYLNADILNLFPPGQIIDPALDPLNPLNGDFLIPDPLGGGFASLPLPPDRSLGGLSLFTQGLVLDPHAAAFSLSGMQQGQTVNFGNSFHIQVSPVPEPAPVWLTLLALICLAATHHLKRKRFNDS